MYVLDHLSIAEMTEMEAINKVFDALDHDGDGYLHMHHARQRLQKRNRHNNEYDYDVEQPAPEPPSDRSAAAVVPRRSLAKHAFLPESRRSPEHRHAPPGVQAPLLTQPGGPSPYPSHTRPYKSPTPGEQHGAPQHPPRK